MKKIKNKRFVALYAIAVFSGICILGRLYTLQVLGGQEARDIVDSRLSLSVPVTAPRGNITDRYGRILARSRKGYFIVIEKTDTSSKNRNRAILNAFSLLSAEEKAVYTDRVPISFETPFTYKEDIKTFQKEQEIPENKTAEEAVLWLSEKYHIDKALSMEEKRLLCGVYAGMEKEGVSALLPYTLAEDVGPETVTRMKEHTSYLPGISVQERPVREYLYPETAVHILGRVGKISEEEYETYREKGYKRTAVIGKQGVEKAFEDVLRGTDGIKTVSKKVNFITPKEAVKGNTVMLTLDLELQQATEKALKEAVSRTNRSYKNGAAAVVTDVDTGEILASASYPAYDVTTFNKNYSALSENPAKPMFHRSLAGLYAPGSTFKPISAIAAIDSGSIDPYEAMETKGEYQYLDRTFQCNIYRTKGETHGTITLKKALGVSCNYYFYELGRRTGIENVAKTAAAFGLGSKTGSELSAEEANGKIATPENRQASGATWYPGDVLQAAIGQSDHLCTPIQLANYAAALANGGTLYQTRILKAVTPAAGGVPISSFSPVETRRVNVSQKALSAVKEGMEEVAAPGGTAETIFAGFPVSVAGKTGSAQVPGGTNGLFIGYAPAENPQIALSVVIENGGAGTLAANAAKEIFAAYFEKPVSTGKQTPAPYTLMP